MKANDLAWSAGASRGEYEARLCNNQIELVLAFEHGRIDRAIAFVNRDIALGDEVGVTYGFGYWS